MPSKCALIHKVSDMIAVLAKVSKINATLFSLNDYLSVLMQKYVSYGTLFLSLSHSPSKCLYMALKLRDH